MRPGQSGGGGVRGPVAGPRSDGRASAPPPSLGGLAVRRPTPLYPAAPAAEQIGADLPMHAVVRRKEQAWQATRRHGGRVPRGEATAQGFELRGGRRSEGQGRQQRAVLERGPGIQRVGGGELAIGGVPAAEGGGDVG